MTDPLRVLCVCTHNRSRSVMIGGLLQRHLTRLGVEATVETAGTMPSGLPATEQAIRLLEERGIDASRHRSRKLDQAVVESSDLILTAERNHVVWIAGQWPEAFSTTFTLPEAVVRAEAIPPRLGSTLRLWLATLGQGRPTAIDYLDADLAEIADPTGQAPAVAMRTFAQIDAFTRRLAEALA